MNKCACCKEEKETEKVVFKDINVCKECQKKMLKTNKAVFTYEVKSMED